MRLLGIIAFGIEPFEGYVYGRKIFIDTDQTPGVYYEKKSIECTKVIAENTVASTKI